jgi:hypothetical protein
MEDAGRSKGDGPPVELPDLLQVERHGAGAVRKMALLLVAGGFFLLGIVFWLIPVVTGLPFHLLALMTLGMASRRVAGWINRHERRLPWRWRLRLRPALRRRWRREGRL